MSTTTPRTVVRLDTDVELHRAELKQQSIMKKKIEEEGLKKLEKDLQEKVKSLETGKDKKTLEKNILDRRAELAKMSQEKKQAEVQKQKDLAKTLKTITAGAKGKEAKSLAPDVELRRLSLRDEKSAKKAAEEQARREANRRMQQMLKAAGPKTQAVITPRSDSASAQRPPTGVARPISMVNDSSRSLSSSSAVVSRRTGDSPLSDDDRTIAAERERTNSDEAKITSTGSDKMVQGLRVPKGPTERVRSASPGKARFPQDDIRKWKKVELIGKGANGKVYSALLQETGQFIAVKQYHLKDEGLDKGAMAQFQQEIEVMKDLFHPNIVQYLGCEFHTCEDDATEEEFNVFLEYIPGNSLETLLTKTGALNEETARRYLRQILAGTKYLHDNGIVHRDIKCANILVSREGEIKLTDFGTAKRVRDGTVNGCQTFSGTPFWMAPEVIKNEEYGRKADVWSIGCSLVEMLTGRHPWWPLQNAFAVMYHVTNTEDPPEIPEGTSSEAIDFLSCCLQRDPDNRMSVDELLSHEYVMVDE